MFCFVYLILVKVAGVNYIVDKNSPPLIYIRFLLSTNDLPMGCTGSTFPFVPVLVVMEVDCAYSVTKA